MPVANPLIVSGEVVTAGDGVVQVVPLSVEYSMLVTAGASSVVGREVVKAIEAEESPGVAELMTAALGATARLLVITRLPVPLLVTATNMPLP